uniref:Protein Wnt n=1 Tax=Ditylenchus dipsaci TaxID=166011 RepID=A0A915EAF6_9BILA
MNSSWVSLSHQTSKEARNDPSKLCPKNKEQRKELGLVASQVRLCQKMSKVMPLVANAAKNVVNSCQKVFSDRRWNCSSVTMAPDLKPDLTKALTHQLAKACALGELEGYCSCGYGDSTAVTSGSNGLEDTYKARNQFHCRNLISISLTFLVERLLRQHSLWKKGESRMDRLKQWLEKSS